ERVPRISPRSFCLMSRAAGTLPTAMTARWPPADARPLAQGVRQHLGDQSCGQLGQQDVVIVADVAVAARRRRQPIDPVVVDDVAARPVLGRQVVAARPATVGLLVLALRLLVVALSLPQLLGALSLILAPVL